MSQSTQLSPETAAHHIQANTGSIWKLLMIGMNTEIDLGQLRNSGMQVGLKNKPEEK